MADPELPGADQGSAAAYPIPDEAVPHAADDVQVEAARLEEQLVAERPVAIGALLAATALIRIGSVGAGLAVGFELIDQGHIDGRVIGLVGSINALSELVFAPILARFADRLGRTRFLIGGPLIGAVGLILVSLTVVPARIAAARLLEGVAAAAFVPTALGTIAAATSHSHRVRAQASGAFEAANLGGYAGGGLLAGFVHHWAHRGSFLIFGCFYIAAAMVCARWIPRVPPLPVSPLKTVVRAITGRGPIRTFIPAWLASFAVIGAILVNLPALLKQGPTTPGQTLLHHLDERVVSAALTAGLILFVLGIALWTSRLTKWGAATTMRRAIPGAWLLCLGLVLTNRIPLAQSWMVAPILGGGILILAGFGPAAVSYLAQCSETFAADRSALMSFYTMTLAAGGFCGGVLGGFASRWLQIDGIALLGLVLSALAFIALGRVVRYDKALADVTHDG